MANIIQLKRSSVSGKQPNIADLQVGEIAVNLADGILYSKNASNAIVLVGATNTSNITEGENLYYTNARAISAFSAGEGIILESNGQIVANVTGGGGGASVTVASTAPGSASAGDLYFDNELLTLFVYYNDGDTQQWVEASPSASNNPFEFSKSLSSSPSTIYSFDATLYRAAKFSIVANNIGDYKFEEVFLVHDGSNVFLNEPPYTSYYAATSALEVSYTANIVSGNVVFYGSAVTGSPIVNGEVNLIRA